jgi:hypothetical protein
MPNARSLRRQYLVLAVLFFLSGAWSVCDVVLSLLQGRLSLNFGVCLLFVGIGMLNGKASSLVWAYRWSVFAMCGSAVMVLLVLWRIPTVNLFTVTLRSDDPQYLVAGLSMSAGALALSLWSLWVLQGIHVVGLKDADHSA